MKNLFGLIGLVFLGIAIAYPLMADEPGQDNPLVSRFDGATMHAYQESEYEEVALPTGPVPRADYGKGGANREAAEEVVALEGRITWISYRSPEGKSTLEILRNFESALTGDGFEVLFTCVQRDECGPGIGRYVRQIVYPDDYWTRKPMVIQPGYVVRGNTRAMLARRDDENGMAHVFLYLSDEQSPPVIHQVVVEGEAMQTGQVETGVRSAEELQAALATEGRAIVDGIFFEHDSAEIRPQSAEALEQMARLLTDNPGIRVLVVGHTDNRGSFEYNTELSQRRAVAVRQALAGDYGIDDSRMSPKGASFMAPVASNATEDGRELNRRVELVLQ